MNPVIIGNATLYLGDCRDVMAALDACSVDAIVTDPPYHLTSMVKRLSRSNTADVEANFTKTIEGQTTNPFQSAARGFMGKAWDGGDIAHSPDIWIAALRVAKPGAYLLAFGGTRTFHRLAVAIEDAGWEIRDTVMWVYGSGFPKSHNGPWGGTALKPAWEPVIMARKPLGEKTVAANVLAHGTGALNIDGCRIEAEKDRPWRQPGGLGVALSGSVDGSLRNENEDRSSLGRWPANLIHDGSEEVTELFPEQTSGAMTKPYKYTNTGHSLGTPAGSTRANHEANSGSAARFFYTAKASRADREEDLEGLELSPLAYGNQAQAEVKRGNTAHAGDSGMNTVKMRGNHHPTVKPTDLMRYLCRLVTPKGGTVLDMFMGSGSTGKATEREGFQFIGIDLDEAYFDIACERIENAQRQARMFA